MEIARESGMLEEQANIFEDHTRMLEDHITNPLYMPRNFGRMQYREMKLEEIHVKKGETGMSEEG